MTTEIPDAEKTAEDWETRRLDRSGAIGRGDNQFVIVPAEIVETAYEPG